LAQLFIFNDSRMTISESFLGKIIAEITETDLTIYFQLPRKESDNIEYKSYVDHPHEGGTVSSRDKKKLAKIFTSIVAFLNTSGGLLIWGAPHGNPLPDEREDSYSGNLTSVPTRTEPDEFFGKVASEISPIPMGISFKIVPLAAGGFCYVFEAIKSESTPHQYKGTYYIRVGASTHTAPHAIVEAMIKKISFPKLEGFMTFGTPATVSEYNIIPCVVFIYNQSKFIQEKNLEFRFYAHGCDFRELSSTHTTPFKFEHDFTIEAKPILHNGIPYYKEYLLVIPREFNVGKNTQIQLLLSFWGERSPAIACNYNVDVKVENIAPYTLSIAVDKKENQYLFEKRDEIERHGTHPGLEVVHSQIIESLEGRLRYSKFYNNMKK
jgi:Putative DNA-binding domain